MPAVPVTVEEVHGRVAFRRFVELPFALHRGDPRWAPPLAGVERWRLDPQRNPFFEHGDAVYLLARRGGRIAGRVTAHVAEPADDPQPGWFGFLAVDDDPGVLRALLDEARRWLGDRGATSLTGPASFTVEDEPGVLVAGFDHGGVTGRPWHPRWYAAYLEANGLRPAPGGDRPTWRLDTTATAAGRPLARPGGALPMHAGPHGDPALVVHGGAIAAVPDVSAPLRRGPMALARALRRRTIDTATVVRVAGDPAVLVPDLCATAARAGYRWLISPWCPSQDPPETVHQVYTDRP